ncbi:MAG TPA: zinc-binding alcohol dehydrogenase family protein [Candidatus Angelobacter sp.]
MRAIYIREHRAIADLKVSDVPVPPVKPGEVLVRVEASGINPSDVASVQGRFPQAVLPRIVGRDFAGHVAEGPAELLGSGVWGSGGDLGITRDGTHAEYVVLPRQAVSRRPKNLSVEEAAAIGVPFVTAFSALMRLGRLKEGEWVIISGAAGAVGQAAIQLAHAKGARIVALVKDAKDHWVSESGKVQALAHSAQGDLDKVVREATNGRGADLALNGVGSSIFQPLLGALAVGGRHVVYSAAGGREITLDIMSFYRNQFSLLGLDTAKLDATQCAAILTELTPLFESGALTAGMIAERYALTEAASAYGRVASGGAGKVVFVMPSEQS